MVGEKLRTGIFFIKLFYADVICSVDHWIFIHASEHVRTIHPNFIHHRIPKTHVGDLNGIVGLARKLQTQVLALDIAQPSSRQI